MWGEDAAPGENQEEEWKGGGCREGGRRVCWAGWRPVAMIWRLRVGGSKALASRERSLRKRLTKEGCQRLGIQGESR